MCSDISISDLPFAQVPDNIHDQVCDGGWVNIEHPVRKGVIMQRLPCATCNSDLSKEDKQDVGEVFIWSH